MNKHSALVILFLLALLATQIGGFASTLQGNLDARDVAVWASSEGKVQFNDDWILSPSLGGYVLLEQGRLADSANLLESIASKDRMASFWLGEVYSGLGRHDEAIGAWRNAGAAPFFLELGHISYAAIDIDTSCFYYLRALEIAPEMALAHMYAGNCYRRTNNLILAEREYLSAIKLNPNFGYPYIHLANLYVEGSNQSDQARYILDACIKQCESPRWVTECQRQLEILFP